MRIIGIIIISLIPMIIGVSKYSCVKQRQHYLHQLIEFMKEIKQSVRFSRTSIFDLLKSMRQEGKYLQFIGESKASDNPADDIRTSLYTLNISIDVKETVSACFYNICECDSESAIEQLDNCILYLEKLETDLIEEIKMKSSMYVKLGFLGSLFILIILI